MGIYVPDEIASLLIDISVQAVKGELDRHIILEPDFWKKFKAKYNLTSEKLEQYFEELVVNGYLINTVLPGTGIGTSFTITRKAIQHYNT